MQSPSPFTFDAPLVYQQSLDSFGSYDAYDDHSGLDVQFFGASGFGPTNVGHMPTSIQGAQGPLGPMPYHSLQAITMQTANLHPFQNQLFPDDSPPPLSANSSSSADSQQTVSLADILPAPPVIPEIPDSSLTAISRESSLMSDLSSPPMSPKRLKLLLKREPSVPISLFAQSPMKKRKTTARKGASHLPPVITKPLNPEDGPITTKNFQWPDVTGLTKKEARLVKNRAAAFLSRQRKREEFEEMEKRVVKLETENSDLLAEKASLADEAARTAELRDQLSKAQARAVHSQAEHNARVKHLQTQLSLLRAQEGGVATDAVARLVTLFSLSLLQNSSDSSSTSVSTSVPSAFLKGDIELDMGGDKEVKLDLGLGNGDAGSDVDAEGSDEETTAGGYHHHTRSIRSLPKRKMRLTLQSPPVLPTPARRTRNTGSSAPHASTTGQLQLTPAQSRRGDGSLHWQFQLSFGNGET